MIHLSKLNTSIIMRRTIFWVILITVLGLFKTNTLMAQAPNDTKQLWQTYDSLDAQGLVVDAKKILIKIQTHSKGHHSADYLKSTLLYAQRTINETDEQNQSVAWLLNLDTSATNDVESGIIAAVKAVSLMSYFEDNKFAILSRTNVATANQNLQASEWSELQFIDAIYEQFNKALSYEKHLIKEPFITYHDVFTLSANHQSAQQVYNNLYEFILDKYVTFNLENKESFSKNFRKWTTVDEKWLTLNEKMFVNFKLDNAEQIDIENLVIKSLQLQTQYYLASNEKHKLAKTTYARIAYFNRTFLFPNAKQLYKRTLQQYVATYEQLPIAASVAAEMIKTDLEEGLISPTEAVLQYESIIQKYPNTAESNAIYNTIRTLKAPSFGMQAENAVLPRMPFKVLINYKNLSNIKLSVFTFLERNAGEENEDYRKRVLKQSALARYEVDLPNAQDLKEHSLEFKMDGLPEGRYMVVSDRPYGVNDHKWFVDFQVTSLTYIKVENAVYVFDRSSGAPVSDAKVTIFLQTYNQKAKQVSKKTNREGKAYFNSSDIQFYADKVSVSKDKDQFISQEWLNFSQEEPQKPTLHYFIFSDRDLYRPGQRIYFKGIIVKRDNNKNTQVVANEAIKVKIQRNRWEDKPIATLALTTNDFGSVEGSFTAPDDGFTGTFFIVMNEEAKAIKVEEYKRPKFFIKFDSLKGSHFVNDQLSISGKATAYAGNVINDATVTYTVERTVNYPFRWRCYWWPLPQNNAEVVAVGTTTTDANGTFIIPFTALPDNSNPEFWPVFSYNVQVKVADINGETHESAIMVNAAYRDAVPTASIPSHSDAAALKNVMFSVNNVNYIPLQQAYTVKIAKLEAPTKLLARRVWPMPDQWLYDEATYRSFFPNDVYKESNNPAEWKAAKYHFQKQFVGPTTENIATAFTTNGWYIVEVATLDAKGQEVVQKYFTHVLIDVKEKIEVPLLIYTPHKQLQPGDNATVKVLSMARAINTTDLIKLNSEELPVHKYSFRVEEAHRGSIVYFSFFVKDNRVYTGRSVVNVPFSNKQLKPSLLTQRSTLLPGSQEKWTYTLLDSKGATAAAEMLATMYDASLDQIYSSSWEFDNLMQDAAGSFGFRLRHPMELTFTGGNWQGTFEDSALARLTFFNHLPITTYALPIIQMQTARRLYKMSYVGSAERVGAADAFMEPPSPLMDAETIKTPAEAKPATEGAQQAGKTPIRTNFNETAFFFPMLRPNDKGEWTFAFTIPEALTTWKWRTIAHTQDWKIGFKEGEVITQKNLMVQPNIPRVFRQNDEVVLLTKVANLTTENITATVTIEIVDAQTLQQLHLPFRVADRTQVIQVPAKQSTETSWKLYIPESVYQPVIVRIFATSGQHSDAEEHYVPVVTNRMLVTETLPLPMLGNGTKTFTLDKLIKTNSATLTTKSLSIEYTTNPIWYVIQALPYLANYPYDCSEQLFSKLYANAVASDILTKSPKVATILHHWKDADTAAFMSNLQKNESLKTALLEETPWVLEAQDEAAQKHRIAALFETQKLSKELSRTFQKLEDRQLSSGAFSWFDGMYPSRYITATIAVGMLSMKEKNIAIASNAKATSIVKRAMKYLAQQVEEDYKSLKRSKSDLKQNNLSPSIIHTLYAASLYKTIAEIEKSEAFTYYLGQVKKYWPSQSLLLKAYIADILLANNDKVLAATIIESLRQQSIYNEEQGRYWKQNSGYTPWHEAPIETQSALIQAFKKHGATATEVSQMQTWLIKNKQTNRWHSTKATVAASYALFADNISSLSQEPKVSIQLGGAITLDNATSKQEAGTGYFMVEIPGKEVKSSMGNVKVSVTEMTSELPSWGAVYWQYFEQYDKISSANSALKVKKEIFKVTQTSAGEQLQAIQENATLHIGDKVVIRIVVSTDRDMEYVHVKDARAACFEPKDALSAYRFQGNLGYYQSTKDISTHFFIDFLPKGTHVLEYTAYANAQGKCSSGMASVQCMYAPEFAAHSQGEWVKVYK